MKEIELHDMEEEGFRNLLENYLLMSKSQVEQIEATIQLYREMRVTGEPMETMKDNLKMAKENLEDAKKAVNYWQKKLDNSDDIEEIYIE